MTESKAEFGMIGMAVMGRNLAMNMADHGFSVAVWNREVEDMRSAVAESGDRLVGCESLEELVAALERPRRVMMMIKAGKPVDIVAQQLRPLLDEGDIIIDGGNSWFEDTRRREADLATSGIRFVGVGVSGGEEGARHGPSLMPGGASDAYERLRPVFEAIAAKTDSGPCVTHVGPDGAGHFVKMVHNGIEYADMQFIAEAYALLRDTLELPPEDLGAIFSKWNEGPLESFLIEITAKILKVKDEQTGGPLIDQVLDQAGQKGTGRWTAQVALDLGVPVPSIAAAIDARVLSSMKPQRVLASRVLMGPAKRRVAENELMIVNGVHDALYAAKIGAYAQGMALIQAGSEAYGWSIDMREIPRIWKGGCIIRARFLDTIMEAYKRRPELPNLLLDAQVAENVHAAQGRWREIARLAIRRGIAVPGMSASLAYYDSYRAKDLPQNLTQAQRDAFGAHTYQRADDPDGPFVHTDWLSNNDAQEQEGPST